MDKHRHNHTYYSPEVPSTPRSRAVFPSLQCEHLHRDMRHCGRLNTVPLHLHTGGGAQQINTVAPDCSVQVNSLTMLHVTTPEVSRPRRGVTLMSLGLEEEEEEERPDAKIEI